MTLSRVVARAVSESMSETYPLRRRLSPSRLVQHVDIRPLRSTHWLRRRSQEVAPVRHAQWWPPPQREGRRADVGGGVSSPGSRTRTATPTCSRRWRGARARTIDPARRRLQRPPATSMLPLPVVVCTACVPRPSPNGLRASRMTRRTARATRSRHSPAGHSRCSDSVPSSREMSEHRRPASMGDGCSESTSASSARRAASNVQPA